MADITAAMVKELRERSGGGMMDCKNALVEAGGDMAKAAEILQKKGIGRAVKAAGRIAADGTVVTAVSPDGKAGVLVEVNCQTDFVAKGDEFRKFASLCASKALEQKLGTVEGLEALAVDGKTLAEHAMELTAKSGEKHAIRRVVRFDSSGLVSAYIHHGARIGALIEVTANDASSKATKDLAEDLTLQIASMNPRFLRRDEVPNDLIEKQQEIVAAQMKNEDEEAIKAYEDFKARAEAETDLEEEVKVKVDAKLKELEKAANSVQNRPESVAKNILQGRVAKWLKDIVFLDQEFVKESKKKVSDLVKSQPGFSIVRFARFEVGEGIEKGPTKDFATEVAEMAAKAQKN